MTRLRKLALAAATAALAITAPANAVTFNLIDTGGAGAGTKAGLGFQIAADYWSSVLTDPFTINLAIGFDSLGDRILGQTGSSTGSLLVQNAYGALRADRTSLLDNRAVNNLTPLTISDTFGPPIRGLDAITNAYVDPATRTGIDTTKTIFDNDGSANNVVLDANTANLKALGFTFDDDGNDITNIIDGEVTFNSDFRFDFYAANGIQSDSFDFVGVAIHEIGHALGFVSGVDVYDIVGRNNGPLADLFESGAFGSADLGEFRVMSVLDLYRYSADGLDWSVGGDKFFSIDGENPLFGDANFSTGSFNGDGSQASHWIDNDYAPRINPKCSNVVSTPIGIMNPTIGNCEAAVVTGLDLAAFDAIGYDVDLNVLRNPDYAFSTADAFRAFGAVPEPATWAQLLFGFGLLGVAMRRMRRRSVATA